MAIEIVMPKLGLTMETGVVGQWLRREGESVGKGDPLVEVVTDKLTNTVESPGDGLLLKITAKPGDRLPVGGLLAYIGAAGEVLPEEEKPSEPSALASKTEAAGPVLPDRQEPRGQKTGRSTPVARKIAAQHGIDISLLTGSGPGGSVVREDVEKAVAAAAKKQAPAAGAQAAGEGEDYELIAYAGMRRVIGENMFKSWSSAAKVDQHAFADMSELMSARRVINEGLSDAENEEKISVTDLLVFITARALERKTLLNATLLDDGIRAYRDVHMGVAVALPNGLVVPVIKNANRKKLHDISRELKSLVRKAKENALTLDDISGGTFTLTNLGGYHSTELFTPLLNPPQVAILGIGRTKDTPVAVNGKVEIRPMAGLSLSHDHRAVDGAPAAEFLAILIGLIECPLRVL